MTSLILRGSGTVVIRHDSHLVTEDAHMMVVQAGLTRTITLVPYEGYRDDHPLPENIASITLKDSVRAHLWLPTVTRVQTENDSILQSRMEAEWEDVTLYAHHQSKQSFHKDSFINGKATLVATDTAKLWGPTLNWTAKGSATVSDNATIDYATLQPQLQHFPSGRGRIFVDTYNR